MLGDSITAGYGLPARDALPARLEARPGEAGARHARAQRPASAATPAPAARRRVDFSVQSDTAVCVVALGGNDLLQGLDPKQTKANLDRIIRRLKARGITVVLAGLTAPTAIGRSYARDFGAVFPGPGQAVHGLALYPRPARAGVAGNPTPEPARRHPPQRRRRDHHRRDAWPRSWPAPWPTRHMIRLFAAIACARGGRRAPAAPPARPAGRPLAAAGGLPHHPALLSATCRSGPPRISTWSWTGSPAPRSA
jgi:hypothetical protein